MRDPWGTPSEKRTQRADSTRAESLACRNGRRRPASRVRLSVTHVITPQAANETRLGARADSAKSVASGLRTRLRLARPTRQGDYPPQTPRVRRSVFHMSVPVSWNCPFPATPPRQTDCPFPSVQSAGARMRPILRTRRQEYDRQPCSSPFLPSKAQHSLFALTAHFPYRINNLIEIPIRPALHCRW